MHLFSLVQCLGYVACILGVAAFLQKKDTRLKGLLAVESAVYTVHFWMLGNLPAALTAFLSGVRSGVAIKTRSRVVAGIFLVINVVAGVALAHHWIAFFPILGGVLGTVAMFLMQGLPMRLALLASTCCWLVNNIAAGSVGGIILESFNALANGVTILRFLAARRAAAAAGPGMKWGAGGVAPTRPLDGSVPGE
jgi:hypothetical protein